MESTRKILVSLIFVIANSITAFCNDSLVVTNEGKPSVADSLHSQANTVADSSKSVADAIDSLNVVAVADSADAFVISTADSVVAPSSKQKKSREALS